MRKFLVIISFQTIAATTILSAFVSISTPVLSQDTGEKDQSPTVEAIIKSNSADSKEKEEKTAITTKDPKIKSSQLDILLKPLLAEQLEVEARAWQQLLQEKAQEISNLEYSIQLQDGEISGEVDTRTEKQVVTSTRLQTEQMSLVNRLNLVLDSLEAKGGDAEVYRKYVSAISGLDFNITDTEGLGLRFTTWLQSEEGGIQFGLNLLKFGGILIATFIAAPRLGKVADLGISRISNISMLFRGFIVMIVKRSVLVFGGLFALASIGVNLGPIVAVLGGVSFVLAFALQSNLGNFASGLMLLINKPFDVGDEIAVAGQYATVDSISLANTRLIDFNDNHLIILPNNLVWGNEISNYTSKDIRRVLLKVNVSFGTDINYLSEVWYTICAENPDVLDDPKPSAFPWGKSYDYYVPVNLKAWIPTKRYWFAYADLLKAVQARLPEAGIEFVSPEQYRNIVQQPITPEADIQYIENLADENEIILKST